MEKFPLCHADSVSGRYPSLAPGYRSECIRSSLMNVIRRTAYRIIISYLLAVWTYGILFAFISGVFPASVHDCLNFFAMPFTITAQLPIFLMRGSGWLFVFVTGLLWIGINRLLKLLAQKKYGNGLHKEGD
jgi:hypothetical protein